MAKFVIDMKTWGRGASKWTDSNSPCLYDPGSGLKCCLGFVGNALGMSSDMMARRCLPSNVNTGKWPDWIMANEDELAEINDNENTDDATKIRLLSDEFAERGDELEFV